MQPGRAAAPARHLTGGEVDDLVDGAADAPGHAAAAAHAAGCERCRGEVDAARALLAAARALPRGVPAPPELWPLVAAATLHERAVRRRVLRSMRWPLLLFVVALVVGTAAVTAAVLTRPRAAVVGAGPVAPPPPQPPAPPPPPAPPRPAGR